MAPASAVMQLPVLALLLAVPSVECGFSCPDAGWVLWGVSCYIFSIPAADRTLYASGTGYQNAVSVCTGIGGNLLVLDTLEEAVFIVDNVYSNADSYLWCTTENGLQATCGGAAGHYYNSPTDHSNGFWDWNSGYPRSSNSPQCVNLKTSDPPKLISSSCTISYSYVCEKAAVFDGITTTEEAQTTPESQPDGTCQRFSTFAKDGTRGHRSSGACLNNHVIETKYARSSTRCASLCLRDAGCRSFNFFAKDERCELNSMGAESAGERDLSAVDGCVYYELMLSPFTN